MNEGKLPSSSVYFVNKGVVKTFYELQRALESRALVEKEDKQSGVKYYFNYCAGQWVRENVK